MSHRLDKDQCVQSWYDPDAVLNLLLRDLDQMAVLFLGSHLRKSVSCHPDVFLDLVQHQPQPRIFLQHAEYQILADVTDMGSEGNL